MIDTGTAITLAVILPTASLIVAILGYKLAKSKKEQDDLKNQKDEAVKNANDMSELRTDIKLIKQDISYIKTDFDKRLTRLENKRPVGVRRARTPASKD